MLCYNCFIPFALEVLRKTFFYIFLVRTKAKVHMLQIGRFINVSFLFPTKSTGKCVETLHSFKKKNVPNMFKFN